MWFGIFPFLVFALSVGFAGLMAAALITFIRKNLREGRLEDGYSDAVLDGIDRIEMRLNVMADRIQRLEMRLGPGEGTDEDASGDV